MTAERWAVITSVFRAALDLPAERRPQFLAGACGTDDGLRRNVERMLAAQSEVSVPAAELLDGSPFHLSPGEPVAQYRIEGKLGEGGMGAVYLAHDTRLQRKVALKLLLPFLTQSENANAYLLHEARAASALNHPNIVTIYEFGSDLDLDFIAMEYLEGRCLDQLIEPGGLPLERVLGYGIQIAGALASAHDAGILHRDLKPSNIMVANGDRIKLLDFGLAQRFDPAIGEGVAGGGLAGTAAYMSPEQAEGRELDHRSDIFSLGVVLYEMATGVRPFTGEGRTEVLRKISAEDPRPPGDVARVPSALDKLILRCCARDPERRWQSMGEVEKELKKLAPNRSAKWIGIGSLAIAASLVLALGTLWLNSRTPAKGRLQTVKFTITPPTLARGADTEIDTEVSISPNGEHITYVDSQGGQLWVRDLNRETARMVPGATRVYQVFWSPDSKHVGYNSGLRDLMRIPLEGGVATRIVTLAGDFRRASWSADGKTILYADTTGLYTVPASGGAATRLVQHPHIEHPSWLNMPDGRRAILYQAVDETPNRHGIYVRMPGEAGHRRLLLTNSGNPYPAYSPTGHIIFADGDPQSSAIWALPFSMRDLRASGKPFRVAQAGSSPQVSASGTLVYSDVPSVRLQLTMHERRGGASRPLGTPQLQAWLALSPDGRKLAVLARTTDPDIWMYDTAQGTATRFTSDAARETSGSWSPDGKELVYTSDRSGTFDVYAKSLALGAEPRTLVSSREVKESPRWSPDGRFLLYESVSPKTRRDLVFRERSAGGRLGDPVVFVSTPADETLAEFSPDGKYVAYSSNESGNFQIFVTDFPGAARKWKISETSGFIARWVRDGRELFYNDWMRIYAVPVSTDGELTFGKAEVVLQRKSPGRRFEVSRDGLRIYTPDRVKSQEPVAVHIVHNWFEEFRER